MTLDDIKALDVGLSWANSLDQIRARQEGEARQQEQLNYDRNIQARRFAGFQGYQQDTANGMSPSDAVRKHGGELFYDNPGAMFKVEQALLRKPKVQSKFTQESRTINGVPMDVQVDSESGRAFPFPIQTPTKDNMPQPFEAKLDQPYLTKGGAITIPNKTPMATKSWQEVIPAVPATTVTNKVPGRFWGTNDQVVETAPEIPARTNRFSARVPLNSLAMPQGQPQPIQPEDRKGKPLDKATALELIKRANGDKAKARELAKQLGYVF